MNVPAIIFVIVTSIALLALPRKWAPIPLLASCCYVTIGQGIVVGPFNLPVYRMALAVGLVRVVLRREALGGGINAIDKLIVAWAGWMVFASLFHEWAPGSGPIYALGFVYNIVLVYFLMRAWCRDLPELTTVLRMVGWLLVPVALAMIAEHTVQKNYFGVMFGGVSDGVYVRDGAIRAQGPFEHPLLAGTVGAVCFPLLVGIWRRYYISATIGLAACITMVIACTSSSSLVSVFAGLLGVLMWYARPWLRAVQWGCIGAYAMAEVAMTRPAYYLISKIDLTGSSTSWHRSRLIEAALDHLPEWWAFGTDYTLHWMGVGLDVAAHHSDITNYYIWIGVIGGLPATLVLIAMMWRAFAWVGRAVRNAPPALEEHRFMIWCLGAGLLAHATASLSMGYPDQSVMFFWLNISAISLMHSAILGAAGDESPESDLASDVPDTPSVPMFARARRPSIAPPRANPGRRRTVTT